MRAAAAFVATLILASPGQAAPTVQLEEMTSTELQSLVAAGTTTALVPVGGTEQNGAHLVLGKHNVRVRVLAARIAERLGDAVVAPVLAYVPEGSIDPPRWHMRWAGTISIPEAAFEATLEGAARSLCRHGLREVVLLGDHGGYQRSLERAAARVNAAPRPASPCRVHALTEYYRVTQTGFAQALKAGGFSAQQIGSHAGLADTALALAVEPALVREDVARSAAAAHPGVAGDPSLATAELGRVGAGQIVDASVQAIEARRRAPLR
jgi:creatinine amidohydrolase/Fe(II)-dependent formamide hydrolase-like protein